MSVIYLKHPVHGTKIASMDLEAKADEQKGWVRYNPDEVVASVNTLEVKRRRKTSE
jgi:hypothetical protein